MSTSSTAISVPLPINPSSPLFQTHPALKFYAHYGTKFPKIPSEWQTISFSDFYSSDCKTTLPDNRKISGGAKSWESFRRLYSSFKKVEREVLSLIVVTKEQQDGVVGVEYEVSMECLTKLGDEEMVTVPQSFRYVLGKADEGKGTFGLQFRELRGYYDLRSMEKAFVGGGGLEFGDLVD